MEFLGGTILDTCYYNFIQTHKTDSSKYKLCPEPGAWGYVCCKHYTTVAAVGQGRWCMDESRKHW